MRIHRTGWMAAVLLCGGCATYDNELLFAESTDIGIGVQPNPTGGAQFNLGYKQRDLAVIPVGAIDSKGEIKQRRTSTLNGDKDSLSVFGQFSADVGNRGSDIGSDASGANSNSDTDRERAVLGRFFATGLAAQYLAKGYAKAWKKQADIVDEALDAAGAEEVDSFKNGSSKKKQRKSAEDVVRVKPRALRPLIFGQSDVLGLMVGTALKPGEGVFSLGYSGQNIAVMPVFAEKPNGEYEGVGGKNKDEDTDAFSVVGQFKAASGVHSIGVSLDRFFATGLAAQQLSEGLAVKIVSELNKKGEGKQSGENSSQ